VSCYSQACCAVLSDSFLEGVVLRVRGLILFTGFFFSWAGASCQAEDGYRLWLRYVPVDDPQLLSSYKRQTSEIVVQGQSATEQVAREELRKGLAGLLDSEAPVSASVRGDGAVVAGTPAGSPLIASLRWDKELASLGKEGYIIRPAVIDGHSATVIASQGSAGVLYGTFHFLRLLQTHQQVGKLNLAEKPRIGLRLLNHWDNLDGSVERGYAGRSLWQWPELPERVDGRILDYARANASIGINGAVLNNVNASPQVLSAPYLRKVAALAGALRPYCIRVYLSANFAAPQLLGGLSTADPLDAAVARWWREKADEIYRAIPDFGGFLVKANSEGQPGPQDYGRNHADGANVLADALAPHGGVVMWRAFVYSEFVPLDGRFRRNVLVQVKNGPLDFQPREPFHPLFGAMPLTPLMAELQITQEYLGQSTHLVYLAPMWKEFLDADTYAKGPGSLVARVVDGTLDAHHLSGVAGVANTGNDRNWCGHDAAQANWFAYGRLAWNSGLRAEEIADDWIRMTWSTDPKVVATFRSILMGSREAYLDYTMPLGLHHLIGGNHYAPMPENTDPRRLDWSATYYHRADSSGLGFDRTRSGSDAVDQYRSPLRDKWNDPATCPDEYLLWFHHLPWGYRMRSGRTLWEELCLRYGNGVQKARRMEQMWQTLEGHIDGERYRAVLGKLRQQVADAEQWRDKCLRYFQKFSNKPIPQVKQ
jgi:alpha-glucuronidase